MEFCHFAAASRGILLLLHHFYYGICVFGIDTKRPIFHPHCYFCSLISDNSPLFSPCCLFSPTSCSLLLCTFSPSLYFLCSLIPPSASLALRSLFIWFQKGMADWVSHFSQSPWACKRKPCSCWLLVANYHMHLLPCRGFKENRFSNVHIKLNPAHGDG